MRAIVYISQETQPFSSQDLRDLLQSAISKNRENGVTGYLHYETGYFMQYIEGEVDALYETMERVALDNRHTIFYRAEDEDLQERRFPDWYMRWEDRDDATDLGTAISELTRTLKPFERLYTNDELDRAFAMYKQIAYDHVLRGIAALKGENDELSSILSMAVHDLQSPVMTISKLIEMYIAEAGDDLDPEFGEFSKFINMSLSRMIGLVDGILEHFETDAQIKLELVDTGALIDEVRDNLRMIDKRHEIVRTGQFPQIHANPLRMWRVLNCLITNGLKYNQSETPRVEISVEQDDQDWQFCVQDNGIGIHPKYQQKVFEIFQRLHSQTTYPGTGVGLATCRKLVEDWNGKIWVSSQEGAGAAFYFTHPIRMRAV